MCFVATSGKQGLRAAARDSAGSSRQVAVQPAGVLAEYERELITKRVIDTLAEAFDHGLTKALGA